MNNLSPRYSDYFLEMSSSYFVVECSNISTVLYIPLYFGRCDLKLELYSLTLSGLQKLFIKSLFQFCLLYWYIVFKNHKNEKVRCRHADGLYFTREGLSTLCPNWFLSSSSSELRTVKTKYWNNLKPISRFLLQRISDDISDY